MASGGNVVLDVAITAPVSEADPMLRQPPALEEFVDETVFSSPASSQTLLATDDENTPLLKTRRDTKPWYRRASPKILVPFALASALCRGMTLAPRVEVFTQIACDELRIEPVKTHATSGFLDSSIVGKHVFSSMTLDQTPLWALQPMHFSAAAHVGHDKTISTATCRIDPAVQQGAAKLQTLIMTLTGALSALTSGFWGQFGDRHGRTCVIAFSIFAMLATDIIFMLAASQSAHPTYSFLTASRILTLSPIIEGSLGGFPTMQAAFNAYISDATAAGTSRAKIFARFFGIIFVGVAAGPTLGSVLPFDPFRISIAIGAINLILVVLLLPESLTREQRAALASMRTSATAEDQKPEGESGLVGRVRGYIVGTLRGTLEPMAILLPKKRTGQGQAVAGKDWSLTFLAMSLALYLLTIAIYSVKFLYAEHVFGWNTKQLSYYLSFIGTLRALNLIVVLPYLIKVYKPKPFKRSSSTDAYASPAMSPHGSVTIIGSPVTPERAASLPPVPTSPPNEPQTPPVAGQLSYANSQLIKRSVRLAKEQQFDLRVARLSMMMDFLSYFLLCSSTSATGFVMTTTLSAFGGGTSPAMQSLALGILGHDQADVGRLFGALSMLSSISSTILSPMIFGSIYSLTVAVFPKAIFIIATAVLMIAFLLLALVQPTRPLRRRDVEDFPPRGRSRRAKDLRRTYSG